ncbi:MAG: cell envelope integrity protein CreD [Flammeovirgaceae bacterium]|nr:cell envelope integrity protein CreD [Flammeovirgaceae bacterium]
MNSSNDHSSLSIFDRFNNWIEESITVKLGSIGFLVLILLIPTAWIYDLINERQQRSEEVIQEIGAKWSGDQTLSGPVLVVPYLKQTTIDKGKDGIEVQEHVEHAYFLPEQLIINGTVEPKILHRGIFDAVVYESKLSIQSQFIEPNFSTLKIESKNVQWQDAYIVLGITDLRGISDNPIINVDDSALLAEPSNKIGISVNKHPDFSGTSVLSSSGIVAKLNLESKESFKGNFNFNLNLKGSDRFDFVPAGKNTLVTVSGPWTNPSFDGEFIPETREITKDGFTASWKILHFNRPFSQQWTEDDVNLSGANFGVKLLVPVDQYQKSIRTSKYGVLIIILTFISLFLVEVTQKLRIHPFQYILIGVALIVYYSLLLSISEQLGYNVSYFISSAATILLISLYSLSFLRKMKLTVLLSILLAIFYSFIFVIIQMQDYSLLIGSIGLFLIVGVLMFFSRKIAWYKGLPG